MLRIRYYFVWVISGDTDCSKRGQTSLPVVGTEIQKTCKFKANTHDSYYLWSRVRRLFNHELLEFHHNFVVNRNSYITLISNFNLRLHKDFPNLPSSSNSCAAVLSCLTHPEDNCKEISPRRPSKKMNVGSTSISGYHKLKTLNDFEV